MGVALQQLDQAKKSPDFACYLVYIMAKGETIGAPVPIRQVPPPPLLVPW